MKTLTNSRLLKVLSPFAAFMALAAAGNAHAQTADNQAPTVAATVKAPENLLPASFFEPVSNVQSIAPTTMPAAVTTIEAVPVAIVEPVVQQPSAAPQAKAKARSGFFKSIFGGKKTKTSPVSAPQVQNVSSVPATPVDYFGLGQYSGSSNQAMAMGLSIQEPTRHFVAVEPSKPARAAKKHKENKNGGLFSGINGFSYTGRLVKDTAGKRGDSDDNGDYKGGDIALRLKRSNNTSLVLGLNAELYTTQKIKGQQYDTAELGLTAGYETGKWGFYAKTGQVNGIAGDLMYSIVDKIHESHGWGKSRKSPASSDPRFIAQIGARRDFTLVDSKHFDVRVVPFVNVGNTLRNAGFTTAAAFKLTQGNSRPDVPGQPIQERTGIQLFGSLNTQAIQYDLRTEKLNTRSVQVSGTAGVSAGFKFATVSLGMSRMLTPELQKDVKTPVGRNEYRLNVKFPF